MQYIIYFAIVGLSSICVVLTGVVGYLYWMQRKTNGQLMNLAQTIQSLLPNAQSEEHVVNLDTIKETPEDDDKVSVVEQDDDESTVSVQDEEEDEDFEEDDDEEDE